MTKKAISQLGDINLDLKKEARDNKRLLGQQIQFMAESGEIAGTLYDPTARSAAGAPVPAYRQVLAAAGIDIRGKRHAQTVTDAFFRDDANRILFPYYIEERYREIQNERTNQLVYTDLVAERLPLNAGQTIAQIPVLREVTTDTNGDPSRVAEGAEFPVMTIDMGDYTVKIAKFGGRLEASKEAVLGAQLALFDRWLTTFARRTRVQKTRAALKLIKNGDGNNNAAPNVNAAGSAVTIAELIRLIVKAAEYGAEPGILTGDTTALGGAYSLDILTSPASTASAAENLRNNGTLPNLLGMLGKFAPIPSVLDATNQLLAIDSDRGLIEVYSPDMDLVEYEYIMKRQMEAVQVSEMLGFGKPDIGVGVTLTLQ